MILIVGVTGVLGRETARLLLASGYKVRGLTRFPENAADIKKLGGEIIQGDLIDHKSLEWACEGMDAVMASAHQLLGTGKYKSEAVDDEGHRTLIDSAKAAGVRHFVYLSAQGASKDHPTDFYRTKFKVENYLKSSGLGYTILRPPSFMEWHVHNLLGAGIIANGKATIYGAGNNPINFISAKNVAQIAVTALTNPSLKGRTLEIGGPDNVTRNQIADLYSRFAGIQPKITNVPTGMMKVMGPILRPVQPVLSRLMSFSVWSDTTDQKFDPSAMLREFPLDLIHVEDFIRIQVNGNSHNVK